MIRLFFAVGVPLLILAALLHINALILLIPAAALALWAYTAGGFRLRCPKCRKRVKIGASTCHHCGWENPTAAQG